MSELIIPLQTQCMSELIIHIQKQGIYLKANNSPSNTRYVIIPLQKQGISEVIIPLQKQGMSELIIPQTQGISK